ncbi:MAG: VWA domain-containing protein [Anaerolineae bacterium]
MKAFAKRTALLVVLVAFAIAWVAVMSLDFSRKGGSVGADGSQATVTYVSESEFPRITVYLSVVDGSAQPLIGLSREAFALTEDGIPVDIEGFIGAGFQPVTAILLIDHSGSMDDYGKMQGAREAAKAFLANLQDERDRIGVTAFDHQESELYALSPISGADRAALNAKVDRLDAEGGTAYYDAVYNAVLQLQNQPGRKVVIALTDGIDEDSHRSLNSAIKFAQESKVPIYTIGLGRDVYEGVLEKMAQETGGWYYFSPEASQLAALYEDLAHALQSEYSLIYTSPTPRLDGTRRDVVVTVEHPGATVSAAGDYTVGGILAPTINFPLFAVLLLCLLFLLLVPGLVGGLVRRLQPSPAPAVSVAPAPAQPPQVVQKPMVVQKRQCPHCGHALRAEAKFCSGCGRTLAPAPAPTAQTTCPRCGRSLRPGAKFCSGCGQPL